MTSSSTEFTAGDGRRFGVRVGIAFLLLGSLLMWRDRTVLAAIAGSIGAFLLVGGFVRPVALGPVYGRWMGLAQLISKVTTPILMGIVYFLVLTPTGLLMRAFGRNPIAHEPDEHDSLWVPREPGKHGDMRRQF